MKRYQIFLLSLLAAVVGLLLFVPVYDYKVSFIFYLLFWITMASSFNIIYGLTGYLPFGFVAFYGIGGYTTAFLVTKLHLSPLFAVLCAELMGALLALLFFPTLRLKGIYFAIVNFSCALALKTIISNLPEEIGGGSAGFSLTSVYNPAASFYSMLVLAILAVAAAFLVTRSTLGIALRSIKQDPFAAEVLGVHTTRMKLYAWLICAVFPAMAGAIDTWYTAIIDPETGFSIMITAKAVLYGMFGGFGTVAGPVLGTVVLYHIDDLVWAHFPTFDVFLLGLVLLLLVLFMPAGIVGAIHRRYPKSRSLLR
ncbi:branched-chain amino acid ABC transporter permease [Brevibacillus marinus]|uniref:branched-chain amino acid ABC transporter permease n=1 Tax=Brevibacillus marinus TaxID=2496837 RepID=UPI000F82C954|nr:branched-chain amino acid ABC transporter permease [Brevibacillus marinus]